MLIMRPFKKLYPFANWVMRFAVVLFVIVNYWYAFTQFDFQDSTFYIATIYIIFTALFFVGGFFFKPDLTVFSSLILILVTLYQAFFKLDFQFNQDFVSYLILGSIFVYFFTTGNKR